MAGVNKVILLGNLGRDPELRYTESGSPVCTFSVATSESWGGEDGKRQERTEWHSIVTWGKTAELCAKYLEKGRQVFIEGKLQTRKWTDKEGAERERTEINGLQVTFVDSRKRREEEPPDDDGLGF